MGFDRRGLRRSHFPDVYSMRAHYANRKTILCTVGRKFQARRQSATECFGLARSILKNDFSSAIDNNSVRNVDVLLRYYVFQNVAFCKSLFLATFIHAHKIHAKDVTDCTWIAISYLSKLSESDNISITQTFACKRFEESCTVAKMSHHLR